MVTWLTFPAPGFGPVGQLPVGATVDPFVRGLRFFHGSDELTGGTEIRAKTLVVHFEAEGRATLDHVHQFLAGGAHLPVGQRLTLRLDGVNLFHGTIEAIDEVEESPVTGALGLRVTAVDLWALAEKRYITSDTPYTDKTGGFIVQDLVTRFLAGEGLTTNSVEPGIVIPTITFKAYEVTVAEALRQVAERGAYVVGIDANADVFHRAHLSAPAPFTVANDGAFGIDVFGASYFGGRQTYRGVVFDRGTPSGYWRLGETSGTRAWDYSPNARNGIVTGGVTVNQPGLLVDDVNPDAAMKFDGSTGWIDVPGSWTFGNTYSIVALLRIPSVTAQRCMVSNRAGAGAVYFGHRNGRVFWFQNNATPSALDSPATYPVGSVHHVVAVRTSSTERKLYVDGALVLTQGETGGLANTGTSLAIGKDLNLGDFWPDDLDEVAIYDGMVLQQADVTALYQAAIGNLAWHANPDGMPALQPVHVKTDRARYRNRQTVRYGSSLSSSVTVDLPAEIAARTLVEGGTGIYHAVDDRSEITDAAEATVYAQALLRRLGRLDPTVTYRTRRAGLRAGQLQTIGLEKHAVAGSFLLTKVTLSDEGKQNLIWEVEARAGEPTRPEASLFERMAREV